MRVRWLGVLAAVVALAVVAAVSDVQEALQPTDGAGGDSSASEHLAKEPPGKVKSAGATALVGSGWCDAESRKGKALVAVVSAPNHVNARNAIRNTWAKDAHAAGIPVKFFVGELPPDLDNRDQVEQALGAEEDVVRLSGFVENYHNLTAKALAIFAFAHDNCYGGVMKVDDDSYVQVSKLQEFLQKHSNLETLYAGQIIRDSPVHKNPKGRWYAYDQFPEERWPWYANGPGFFLGDKALRYIKEHRDSINKIRIDDAAVGVWTRDMNLDIVDMRVSHFAYKLGKDDSVWLSPVNHEEMVRLFNGERFTPKVCEVGQPTACLCWGSPHFSSEESSRCWQAAGEAEYEDVVPRLN